MQVSNKKPSTIETHDDVGPPLRLHPFTIFPPSHFWRLVQLLLPEFGICAGLEVQSGVIFGT